MNYLTYKEYLISRYKSPVYRIGVDGGFSCPNRDKNKGEGCFFCDATGSVAQYQRRSESSFNRKSSYHKEVASSLLANLDSIEKQVIKGKEFLTSRYKAELFSLYFQSYTNTYGQIEDLKQIYDRALSLLDFKEFIISTRPDTIEEEKLELLESYQNENRQVWIELGLQSSNNDTLSKINRGHTKEDYIDGVKRAKKHNLMVSTHVIFGLPGEDNNSYLDTIECVNNSGSDAIKIHNLHITGGTKFEKDYLEGAFTVPSFKRHLESVILALRHLKRDIIVQRLICETPSHRLVAPRYFPDKNNFLIELDKAMKKNNYFQGDLWK